MEILIVKPIKDVVIEDLIQYAFFRDDNLSKLEATLESLKEKKASPEIADIGFFNSLLWGF